jgi:hypothetical protein
MDGSSFTRSRILNTCLQWNGRNPAQIQRLARI